MSQNDEVWREKNEVPLANNALLFRLAISKSFENIVQSVSEKEFLELLTIVKSKPSLGRKLYNAMIGELSEGLNNHLEEIFQEDSLVAGLAELSKLAEEADTVNNEAVWRPPGDVKLHLRSLDAEKIKAESEKLEKRLTEMEMENSTLMKKLVEGRAKVCATSDRMARNLHRLPMIQEHLENQVLHLQHLFAVLEGD